MACQGAVPPTEAEVKQVVQEEMALLSSKYHLYREPIEQYRARMMPTLRENFQRLQQQRQAADEALERGIRSRSYCKRVYSYCNFASLRRCAIPTSRRFRKCLGNGLRWQVESDGGILPVDATTSEDFTIEESSEDEVEKIEKQLIVIVPSMTKKQLAGWGAKPSGRKIAGLYELAPIWCATIVLTRELLPTAETIWLRLLSRGTTQRAALGELMQLNSNNPLRDAVLRSLQHWYQQMVREQTGRESPETMRLLSQIEI